MPATTGGQVAAAQSAGRPQPQTTVEPAGGPFIRHSQIGRRSQYLSSSNAYGAVITQPLVAVPGYISGYRIRIAATGGTSGSLTVACTADAPFNAVALVQLRDAFGTPIITAPGFEALYLIPKYGGQYGVLGASDIKNMPTFSAVSTGASGTGNFSFASFLPFEFAKAYGLISGANASLLPTLQLTLNPSSTVFSTGTAGTVATIEADVDADFYWLPEGVNVEPPGLGSTCQWVLQQCNPTVGSAATVSVSLPRLGGYINTLILIARDTSAIRVDAWGVLTSGGNGSRLRFTVDGVPLIDSRIDEIYDDIYNAYGGITRDTGVIAFTRRTALGRLVLGLLDTGEQWLSTNPGTLLQIEMSPWATGAWTAAAYSSTTTQTTTTSTAYPATINVLAAQVVPSGSLIQGLPEL